MFRNAFWLLSVTFGLTHSEVIYLTVMHHMKMWKTTTVASIKIPCFPRIDLFFHKYLASKSILSNTSEHRACFVFQLWNSNSQVVCYCSTLPTAQWTPHLTTCSICMWLNGFTSPHQAVSQGFATDSCMWSRTSNYTAVILCLRNSAFLIDQFMLSRR